MRLNTLAFLYLLLGLVSSCKGAGADEWRLVWSEEFDQTDYIDYSVWAKISYDRCGYKAPWNKYMKEYPELYDVKDGHLILRGLYNKGENPIYPDDTCTYLTGGVWTRNKMSFEGGRIAIRAKIEGARGAWPALWMKPAEEEISLKHGEIDIMERLNSDAIAYQTAHNYWSLDLGNTHNPEQQGTGTIDVNDYNVYSVEIYEDRLIFAVNDIQTLVYPYMPTFDIEDQFPYFNHPFYLIMDMQIEGVWPGSAYPEDYPIEMWIDWVRYYKKPE